jgi:hypothetical protein
MLENVLMKLRIYSMGHKSPGNLLALTPWRVFFFHPPLVFAAFVGVSRCIIIS